jgi:predicted dehydrogenase
MGFIGVGKQNGGLLRNFLRRKTRVVAVCEVDKTRRDAAVKTVNDYYENRSGGNAGGCAAYNDFRELIARDDIDAVCIATPDHWHTIPMLAALRSGKDVYCEKPLTHNIHEAVEVMEAVKAHGRVLQTGSMQRSSSEFRIACELVRNGVIGTLKRAECSFGDPGIPCDLPAEDMEPGLDWDLWQGPAPKRPYNSILSPRGVHTHFPAWRSYREYSGGGHTDMGAHHYDIAQWALDMDESGPVEIIPPDDPNATKGVRFIYANGIEMIHGGPSGCVFHGENGTLHIDRGRLTSDPEELVKTPLAENEVHLPESPGHHRDWLDCIKSRKMPIAEVEKGARTVTIIHLGNLAYWNHKTLKWNPQEWKFEDSADDKWLDRERRDPWQLPDI